VDDRKWLVDVLLAPGQARTLRHRIPLAATSHQAAAASRTTSFWSLKMSIASY
jgi:hypothetical protein